MKSVKLIDTSVLCELLEIPGKSNTLDADKVKAEFCKLVRQDVSFILPLATVLETGNHIAQNGNGNVRRTKAKELADFVVKSLEEASPFLSPPFWQDEDLRAWMSQFPTSAMQRIGLGDVSIKRDLERARERLPSATPVEIWSKVGHLS